MSETAQHNKLLQNTFSIIRIKNIYFIRDPNIRIYKVTPLSTF